MKLFENWTEDARKIRIRAAKFKKSGEEYPFIKALGLTIVMRSPDAIPGLDTKELYIRLGKEMSEEFNKLFGCQTIGENGPYIYDCEAVFERMFNNRLTGTQLWID